MDIYVVLDDRRVVGASTRYQGAEVIRADEARRLAGSAYKVGAWTHHHTYQSVYDRLDIVNTELQDAG